VLLGLGALFTRCWKAESLSLMAVSASSLKAFTCIASRFHSAHLVRALRAIGGDTSPTIIVSGGCVLVQRCSIGDQGGEQGPMRSCKQCLKDWKPGVSREQLTKSWHAPLKTVCPRLQQPESTGNL
jgi:hypothetical protein